MVLVPLLLAPTAMVAVSAAERRFGPATAGWLNAFPLSIAVSIVAVTSDQGWTAGAEIAYVAVTHVPAILALSVTWAAVLTRGARRRFVVALGLLAGTGAFVAASVVLALIPAAVATALAVPALALAPRLTPGGSAGPAPVGSGDVAIRAGAALAVVLAVLVAVRVAGPGVGGSVAAFPALTVVLAVLIARARGPMAAACALGGQVRGLAGYFAFCLVVSIAGRTSLGLALTVPLGFAACVCTASVAWVGMPRLSPP